MAGPALEEIDTAAPTGDRDSGARSRCSSRIGLRRFSVRTASHSASPASGNCRPVGLQPPAQSMSNVDVLADGGGHGVHAPVAGQVGGHRRAADLSRHALCSLAVDVGDDDVHLLLGQGADEDLPEAAAATGHDRSASRELHAYLCRAAHAPAAATKQGAAEHADEAGGADVAHLADRPPRREDDAEEVQPVCAADREQQPPREARTGGRAGRRPASMAAAATAGSKKNSALSPSPSSLHSELKPS